MAIATAVGGALRRAAADPKGTISGDGFRHQALVYDRKWSYYANNPYDIITDPRVVRYLQDYGLYRATRPIYNPTRRLAKWWAGAVYGGPMSEDGQDLPNGIKPAIPFSPDTPKALILAATRCLLWGNWQLGKSLYVKYGAVLGSVFIEIVDDLDRGKVYPRLVWPGYVTDLDLDASDNVKLYEIAFHAEDRGGVRYRFKKRVDATSITIWRNDQIVSEVRNPYGFVPGIWTKHEDDGDDHGAGVLDADIAKLDELNSVASHIADQIHKRIHAVKTIATGTPAKDMQLYASDRGNRDTLPFLKLPPDAVVGDLSSDLNLADALAWVQDTYAELERDYPELVFYEQMRDMQWASGPAIQGLIGDVAPRFYDAAGNYDLGTTKASQMGAAIGGFRAGTGAWGSRSALSRHQQAFLPFNLDSYAAGNLDLAIVPRLLVAMSDRERFEIAEIKKRAYALSDTQIQREAGYSDRDIENMKLERQEQSLSFATGLGQVFNSGNDGQLSDNRQPAD